MKLRRVLVLAAGILMLAGVAASQRSNTPEARLRAAMDKETIDGDLKGAIEEYKKVIGQRGVSRDIMARALLRLGQAYEKQGDAEARKVYERLTREFSDQTTVAQQAQARMAKAETAASGTALRQVCAGDACSGFISPDGSLLVSFTGNVMSVREVATGKTKQLVTPPAGRRVCCTGFSADGKRLAYTLAPQGANGDREVIVANIDGSDRRIIYRGGSLEDWSPDGRQVLVASATKVLWVNVADGTTQDVPLSGWDNFDILKISPDGKYIALSGNKPPDTVENVYIMAADGSGETRVSRSTVYQEPVGWSPDGKYLLYGQYGRSNSSVTLWAVSVAEGKVAGPAVSIREFDGRDSLGPISASGTLYYRTLASGGATYTASMDPATGRITSIPAVIPSGGPMAWSADSRRIAYLANRGALQRELRTFSLDDGKDQRVPASPVFANSLCWPAGSDSILTNTTTGTPPRFEPVRVNLTTGEISPVFPGSPSFRLWSCTDTLATSLDATAVRVRNLQSGAETELYRIKRPVANYGMSKLSPNGRSIAFLESLDADTSALMVIPSSGGPVRELTRAKAPAKIQEIDGHAWSHDSRFVYFLKRDDSRSPYDLVRISVQGGAEERIMGLREAELRGLEISPDGRMIFFGIAPFNRPEIWAMDHFLSTGR
jgi:Tol biopolymer transport system component